MIDTANGFFEHVTIDGDRWDLLAYRYYGDQHKMTVLLEANRNLFMEPLRIAPMILPAGLTLKVPLIEEETVDEAGLPPWKRSVPNYAVAL